MTKTLDNRAHRILKENPNMAIPWYLMAAYAYYEEDDPILSDSVFDNMSKFILENWDDLEHRHKNLLDEDMLQAGTFIGTYPAIVLGSLGALRNMKDE